MDGSDLPDPKECVNPPCASDEVSAHSTTSTSRGSICVRTAFSCTVFSPETGELVLYKSSSTPPLCRSTRIALNSAHTKDGSIRRVLDRMAETDRPCQISVLLLEHCS